MMKSGAMLQEETDYPSNPEVSDEDDKQELISLSDHDNIQSNELVLDDEEEIATGASETKISHPKWGNKVFDLPVRPDFDEYVGPSD